MNTIQINRLYNVKCNTFNTKIINNNLYIEYKSFLKISFYKIFNYHIYNKNICKQITNNKYKL